MRIIIHRLVTGAGTNMQGFRYMFTIQHNTFDMSEVDPKYARQFLPAWIQPL